MTSVVPSAETKCEKLDRRQIENRLRGCMCLPSLGSIENALKDLLNADQRYTSQIAEIIRRDPSLTARLLRLVNSVFYGVSRPIKSIEEAVFYLGVRQIRQLAMVTPIIEDFQKLAGAKGFPWREFWRHCIGTALMTREVIDLVQSQKGEIDYVAGLIHDVGKIAMASAFPEHFEEIYHRRKGNGVDLLVTEREVLGIDHAELGALYLKRQSLPDMFIEIARKPRCTMAPWSPPCRWRICSCATPRSATAATAAKSPRKCGRKAPAGKFCSRTRRRKNAPSPAPV
jgi:HD-like signal output (HDOD) protein